MLRLARLVLLGLVLSLMFAANRGRAIEAASPGTLTPLTSLPPNGDVADARWYSVAGPAGTNTVMLIAFFGLPVRPGALIGKDAILVLHGTSGFARQHVEIAKQLHADTGLITAAACWFSGDGWQDPTTPGDQSDITPIACPDAPPFKNTTSTYSSTNGGGASRYSWPSVRSLLEGVRNFSGPGKVGVFGHSRGAEIAAQMASFGYIDAVALSAGVYRDLKVDGTPMDYRGYDYPPPYGVADKLAAPALVLHGTQDTQTNGATFTYAQQYVQKLQSLSKPVQWCYYDPFGHDAVLHTEVTTESQYEVFLDQTAKAGQFFKSAFAATITSGPAPGCGGGTLVYCGDGSLKPEPPGCPTASGT
jgi:dienelactone hydrolase